MFIETSAMIDILPATPRGDGDVHGFLAKSRKLRDLRTREIDPNFVRDSPSPSHGVATLRGLKELSIAI